MRRLSNPNFHLQLGLYEDTIRCRDARCKGCVDLFLLTSMRINFSKSVSGQLLCNRQFAQNVAFLSFPSRPGTND
jgi:hypothetical protein